MSYEVYIDVRHHPRHLDDWEKKETWCAKLDSPEGATPTRAEYLPVLIDSLRDFADELERELEAHA